VTPLRGASKPNPTKLSQAMLVHATKHESMY
jgi:hypothetical protein